MWRWRACSASHPSASLSAAQRGGRGAPPTAVTQLTSAGTPLAVATTSPAPPTASEPPPTDPAAETHAAIATEVARVKALPKKKRAALGSKYTDAEKLFLALEAGGGDATLILRTSWVKNQRGGRLPKRGDTLPPEATITVKELRAIHKASKCKHALPVIALSQCARPPRAPQTAASVPHRRRAAARLTRQSALSAC